MADALAKFMSFDKALQACDLQLLKSENGKRAWKPVKDVQLDDLPNQMARAKSFQHRLATVSDAPVLARAAPASSLLRATW